MSVEIRFYDNEEANWEKDMNVHSDHIEWHPVDSKEHNEFSKPTGSTAKSEKYTGNQTYIDYFAAQDNKYAQFLRDSIEAADAKTIDKIIGKAYPNRGITDVQMTNLDTWSKTPNVDKYVLFDWDRTITVVEGMYFNSFEGRSLEQMIDSNIDHVLLFIMGGEERLSKIRRLFQTLKTNGVHIYIITHNSNASKSAETRSSIYSKLIKRIFPGMVDEIYNVDDILYCSRDYCYKKSLSTCAIEILRELIPSCADAEKVMIKKLSASEVDDAVNAGIVPDMVKPIKKAPSSAKPSTTKKGRIARLNWRGGRKTRKTRKQRRK